ncbi:site-specific integrase [Tritonibacter scottomollicae]|uniref:Site-specific integrase n=1 Tax=Tritonibacter scottomollicae TaxID=483013 RepID=A0ABZ0HDF2_TRISK|nr:site-specific integrase [Tritonibacter scottomollicae]WOI32860.1 site-specific integrase [Tritonibacter scottomollicae]
MPLKLSKRSKNGPYYARGTVAGHKIFESTGLSNKRQAEAWAIRKEHQILERHALGGKATLTFAEAAHDYMMTGGDARFLEKILLHLGPDQLVSNIDNHFLLQLAETLYPDGSAATKNRQVITPVSAIINMAADNGKADHRRFRRLKAKGARTRWLTPEEFEALCDQAPPHLKVILTFMIGTGCRTSEALSADVRYWHASTGEIWLPETKNGHARMVQMPQRARDLILSHGVPRSGPLLRSHKGLAYVARDNSGGHIKKAFCTARENARLGADVTPHVLRHTWATWFYASTRDYGRLLDLGGWRTSSTAERYRKLAPSDLGERLKVYGWDFSRLGDQLPKPEERRAAMRAV